MPSKRILFLSILISFSFHTMVLSLTGFIDITGNRDSEEVMTVDLKEDIKKEEYEQIKNAENKPSVLQSISGPVNETLHEDTTDLGSEESRYAPYLRRIKKRIENAWVYPRQASESGEEGITKVKFSINRNGALIGSVILSSSGSKVLDQGIIDVIKSVAPYEPLPPDINISRLHIVATFRYILTY